MGRVEHEAYLVNRILQAYSVFFILQNLQSPPFHN